MTPTLSPLAHRSLLLAGVFALTTGCVVYDDTCDDGSFWSDDSGWGDDGYGDDGGDDARTVEFWMDPDTVHPGETLIAGLQADAPLDWSQVVEVEIFGDITLCTTQARQDELLLTLAVDADARLGGVDLLLHMQDGDVFFIEDAMSVVAGDGGGDASTDGGSGSDGSGSGSDGSGSGSGSDGSGSGSGGSSDGSGAGSTSGACGG
ncbi:MAG: hypothetical protein H6742_06695 [Alphaproteobacteria bacterium]|nr:hypothetical protein [Alphaproteobacteria bacterium]